MEDRQIDSRKSLYIKVGAILIALVALLGGLLLIVKPWSDYDPYAWVVEQCGLAGKSYVQTHPEVPSLMMDVDLKYPDASSASLSDMGCLLRTVGVQSDAYEKATLQLEPQVIDSMKDSGKPLATSVIVTPLAKVTLFMGLTDNLNLMQIAVMPPNS